MEFTPLSVAQQGLWFLGQVDVATSAAYNMVYAFETAHAVDEAVLRACLEQMARHHETLRATIVSSGGIPNLRVPPSGQAVAVPLRRTATALREVAREEGLLPFDLANAPLYRVTLVEPAGQAAGGLVFTFPHLVFDDGSATVFFGELLHRYDSLLAGTAVGESGPVADLRTLAQGERDYVTSPRGLAAVADAAQRLRGIPHRLVLPRTAPVADGALVFPAAVTAFFLPADVTAAVTRLAQSLRATPAAVYLAVFDILLWRYSGQADFGVSIPVANRAGAGRERSLGYLTNLGVIRASLAAADSAQDFIGGITDQLLDLLDAPELPFPAVAKQLKRAGQDIQGPLLQVGFNYLKAAPARLSMAGERFDKVEIAPGYVKNEFKLDVQETADGARCWLLYDRDGFDAEVVRRMAGHFQRLLDGVLAAPDTPLAALPMLSEAERRHTVGVPAPAALDAGHCLHTLFEGHAARTPDVPALDGLTYGALNRWADVLAQELRARGTAPGQPIAIHADGSAAMLAGMLAVLKAGAAFVPIDTRTPAGLVAPVLQDCGAALLLSGQAKPDGLPGGVSVLDVAAFAGATATAHDVPAVVAPVVSPSHRAACLYLTGDAAGPVGLEYSHRDLVHRLLRRGGVPVAGSGLEERIEAVWTALIDGAPVTWNDAGTLPPVRPGRAYWEAEPAQDATGRDITLARPGPGVGLLLLGRDGAPLPAGVAGEIHVAAGDIGQGYWQRPGLTAERFVAHPFEAGARLYRSGMFGRYGTDGTLALLGRVADRVEWKGSPVDLGRIELALAAVPGVRAVAVALRCDSDEPCLTAYVVSAERGSIRVNDLRAHLQKTLPGHMIPAAWAFVEQLPMGLDGTVDRPALPAPQLDRADAGAEYVAPRNPVEQQLLSIWSAVLQVERPGVFDNFFVLGGHSLLAMQVIAQASEQLAVTIPLRAFFETPTIAALAAQVAALRQAAPVTALGATIARQARQPSRGA